MNISLQLDERTLEQTLERQVTDAQAPVQQGMAEQFRDIVMSNFGETGLDRPALWPPLSDRSAIGRAYIKKVGRTYATLYETGAMAGAVKQTDGTNGSEVSLSDSDVPYSTMHHEGSGHVPRRRVFPILDDGQITDKSKAMVIDAAAIILKEVLNG